MQYVIEEKIKKNTFRKFCLFSKKITLFMNLLPYKRILNINPITDGDELFLNISDRSTETKPQFIRW